jgi:apoptosis-inducing factor 2
MRVVIVGGGFSGSIIAKRLHARGLHFTLIDRKPYFEYFPSLAKVIFDPSYLEKITVPFTSFLQGTTIVTDEVLRVTETEVQTAHNKFPFDVLVVASGIDYPIFLKQTQRLSTIRSARELAAISPLVMEAKQVLIIGGGLIGTELAGEFATRTPDKKITVVHAQSRLLERNMPSVSAYAQKFLEDRGVSIILGEKIVDRKRDTFVTSTKRAIHADFGFWCAGIKANPTFMDGFPPSIFSDHRTLRVNQHLQLVGYPNIFVCGDITNFEEEKNAAHANSQAGVITENVLRTVRHKPLLSYHSKQEPADISLGSWDGIITYPPFVMVGFIPGIGKKFVEFGALTRLRW